MHMKGQVDRSFGCLVLQQQQQQTATVLLPGKTRSVYDNDLTFCRREPTTGFDRTAFRSTVNGGRCGVDDLGLEHKTCPYSSGRVANVSSAVSLLLLVWDLVTFWCLCGWKRHSLEIILPHYKTSNMFKLFVFII